MLHVHFLTLEKPTIIAVLFSDASEMHLSIMKLAHIP